MHVADPKRPGPEDLLDLVEQVAEGSDLAFERLWRLVEPRVDAAVRNPRLLHKLADRPAERADCKQTIALKLRRVLPTYLEYRRQKGDAAPSLLRWVGVVINNTSIDFRRSHPEYERGSGADERERRWRTFVDLTLEGDAAGRAGIAGARDDQTLAISQARQFREMIQWASSHLPADQLDALLRWIYAEDDRQTKQARAALRKLRDQFREASQ